jgi:cell division septation protein DedD
MSRLDYITIGIVAACILAIIFLVYKMTDLFNGQKVTDKVETTADSVEVEDDVYDYEIDESVDSTGASGSDKANETGTSTTKTQPTTTPAPKPAAPAKEQDAATSAAEDDEETNASGGSSKPDETAGTSASGKFLVLAGSFTQKSGAQAQVNQLRKKGYENAKVEIFDRGKFAVVLVDRFDNMADAERLVKQLKADGVKCYVKLKS